MITKLSPISHIAEGSRARGELVFFSEAEVFGVVEGSLCQNSLEKLIIGPLAVIHGDIVGRGPIVIAGSVEGSVSSDTQVRCLPTARITGTILAPSIAISAGATVNARLLSARESRVRLVKAAA